MWNSPQYLYHFPFLLAMCECLFHNSFVKAVYFSVGVGGLGEGRFYEFYEFNRWEVVFPSSLLNFSYFSEIKIHLFIRGHYFFLQHNSEIFSGLSFVFWLLKVILPCNFLLIFCIKVFLVFLLGLNPLRQGFLHL